MVAFTGPDRPLISVSPAYEGPIELTRALGRPVVLTPLREDYTADVKKLAEAADRAKGGLIYLCNPNNPTSAMVKSAEIDWLVANLPARTVLLVDEAYIHFGESPDLKSALPYVRQGKDVIVTRTFSKIYGMAGLRVGFAAARPEFIGQLAPLRINVISIVTARAVLAALANRDQIVPARRAALAKTRARTLRLAAPARCALYPAARQFHHDRLRPQRARVHRCHAQAGRGAGAPVPAAR